MLSIDGDIKRAVSSVHQVHMCLFEAVRKRFELSENGLPAFETVQKPRIALGKIESAFSRSRNGRSLCEL